MQTAVKGMVHVNNVTYRIVRVRAGEYDVVRLLDDARIGMFSIGAQVPALCQGDSPELIRDIARTAVRFARTSWAPGLAR